MGFALKISKNEDSKNDVFTSLSAILREIMKVLCFGDFYPGIFVKISSTRISFHIRTCLTAL